MTSWLGWGFLMAQACVPGPKYRHTDWQQLLAGNTPQKLCPCIRHHMQQKQDLRLMESHSVSTTPHPAHLMTPLLQKNTRTLPQHNSRLLTAMVVLAWFVSNIGLLLMNKYLLSNYGFQQPVFLTLCHMLMCIVLSAALGTTSFVPKKSIQSSKQLMKIFVLAVVFAVSVVMGNISLRSIPVSFAQVVPPSLAHVSLYQAKVYVWSLCLSVIKVPT